MLIIAPDNQQSVMTALIGGWRKAGHRSMGTVCHIAYYGIGRLGAQTALVQ